MLGELARAESERDILEIRQELAEGGFLLEHAEYVGNRYGTPRGYVESRLLEGRSVVLDIEVQGAAQVQRNCPDAVTVFILPPSGEELERRLRHRNTDSDEKIRERLLQAKRECAEAGKYGYIVRNLTAYSPPKNARRRTE